MPDNNFSEQMLLLRADFTAMNAMVQYIGTVCADRHDHLLDKIESVTETVGQVGNRVEELGQEMVRLGRQTVAAMTTAQTALAESRRASAESRERWNQLSGRLSLTEGRMTGMLGAVDSDRLEWRVLYRQLDERVTEMEKRLPPPEEP